MINYGRVRHAFKKKTLCIILTIIKMFYGLSKTFDSRQTYYWNITVIIYYFTIANVLASSILRDGLHCVRFHRVTFFALRFFLSSYLMDKKFNLHEKPNNVCILAIERILTKKKKIFILDFSFDWTIVEFFTFLLNHRWKKFIYEQKLHRLPTYELFFSNVRNVQRETTELNWLKTELPYRYVSELQLKFDGHEQSNYGSD